MKCYLLYFLTFFITLNVFSQGIELANRVKKQLNEQNYYGALQDLNILIDLYPDNQSLYQNRGLAKLKLKDYSGAIKDLNKAIEMDSSDYTAYNNRGLTKKN